MPRWSGGLPPRLVSLRPTAPGTGCLGFPFGNPLSGPEPRSRNKSRGLAPFSRLVPSASSVDHQMTPAWFARLFRASRSRLALSLERAIPFESRSRTGKGSRPSQGHGSFGNRLPPFRVSPAAPAGHAAPGHAPAGDAGKGRTRTPSPSHPSPLISPLSACRTSSLLCTRCGAVSWRRGSGPWRQASPSPG